MNVGSLLSESARNRLKRLFKKLDTDQDGYRFLSIKIYLSKDLFQTFTLHSSTTMSTFESFSCSTNILSCGKLDEKTSFPTVKICFSSTISSAKRHSSVYRNSMPQRLLSKSSLNKSTD